MYLLPFYYGEIGVSGRLRRLMEAPEDRLAVFSRFDWPAAFAVLQAQNRVAFSPRQMEAVQAALTHKVTVLTGGPGTGKTTTVRGIIRLAEAAGLRTALASPTGRAAKRLSEATGRPVPVGGFSLVTRRSCVGNGPCPPGRAACGSVHPER